MKTQRLAVIGGGPAGLASAIEASRRGLEVTVFERRTGALDKACGEGLMPAGASALARLGALERISPERCAPFQGIRYVQEDGTTADGRFRGGQGLGIRRTALVQAMRSAAQEAGAQLLEGIEVRAIAQSALEVTLDAGGEPRRFDLAVIADGLHSPLRRALGIESVTAGPLRFGMRRHFCGVAAGRWVEVHWASGVECYVTPVAADEVGVAFLWSKQRHPATSFERLLECFPQVGERLGCGRASSAVRGAGPMACAVRTAALGRVALVGDAAGYLDAITGEGLSLAFAAAERLGVELGDWASGDPNAPLRYAQAHAKLMARYVRLTRPVLALARWPAMRKVVVRQLARWPRGFELALEMLGGKGDHGAAWPMVTKSPPSRPNVKAHES